MDVPRYYRLLQVLPEADPTVVSAAYRALARKHHPDMQGGDARVMGEINEAWAVLQRVATRAAYDQQHGIGAAPGVESSGTHPSEAARGEAPPQAAGPIAARHGRATTSSVITFGRYEGWRLHELVRHDRSYLEWLARSPMGMRFRAEIGRLLAAADIHGAGSGVSGA